MRRQKSEAVRTIMEMIFKKEEKKDGNWMLLRVKRRPLVCA